jgi:hypothetical protein
MKSCFFFDMIENERDSLWANFIAQTIKPKLSFISKWLLRITKGNFFVFFNKFLTWLKSFLIQNQIGLVYFDASFRKEAKNLFVFSFIT